MLDFVDTCTRNVEDVLHLSNCNCSSTLKELYKPIKPAPTLQREPRLWLAGIRHRIGGKRSIRNPFYMEINRDCPIVVRIVGGWMALWSLSVFTVRTRQLLFLLLQCIWLMSCLVCYLGIALI